MDDFLSLVVVFIIYLVAASSGKKKKGGKGRKRSGPMRSRAQGERRDARAAQRDEQTKAGFDAAFAQPVKEPVCRESHPRQMHLHEVDQSAFAHAAEGEDPCHAAGVDVQADVLGHAVPENESQQQFAQDVLRGVVMSEILTRPCERRARAAMQRGRR